MADRKIWKKIEREASDVECEASLPLWSGDGGTDRNTKTEAAGLLKQLGQKDCGSEEGGSKENRLTEGGDWYADELDGNIGEMPAEMAWAHGADGGRENGKESGSVEGVR